MTSIPPSWLTEDLSILADNVARFAARELVPYAARCRAQRRVDREAWLKAGAAGLLCASIPAAYGGGGGDRRHDAVIGTELEAFGGLDIIVNNAGYTIDSVIQKMSDDQFQTMLDVHTVAPFRILRAAAEPIRLFAKKRRTKAVRYFGK